MKASGTLCVREERRRRASQQKLASHSATQVAARVIVDVIVLEEAVMDATVATCFVCLFVVALVLLAAALQ